MPIAEQIKSYGIGWIIALLILILAVVAIFIGKPLTDIVILAFIAGLAASRLL